jgi:hypothetical protein
MSSASDHPPDRHDPEESRARWFKNATPEQKRAAVHILVAMATGDGKFTTDEKRCVAEACTRLNVSAVDVAQALMDGMPVDIEVPKERRDRVRLLSDAAAVMVADKHVDDRELAILFVVGASLGFSATYVSKVATTVTRAMQERDIRETVLARMLDDSAAE